MIQPIQHIKQPQAPRGLDGSSVVELFSPLALWSRCAWKVYGNKVCLVNNLQVISSFIYLTVFAYKHQLLLPVHHTSAIFRRGSHCLFSFIYQQLRGERQNLSDHRLLPTKQWLPNTAYVTLCFHGSPPALLRWMDSTLGQDILLSMQKQCYVVLSTNTKATETGQALTPVFKIMHFSRINSLISCKTQFLLTSRRAYCTFSISHFHATTKLSSSPQDTYIYFMPDTKQNVTWMKF
jgi:hypothetical protein